jgi:antitoxin component of MazEF toxin-antitoxin module
MSAPTPHFAYESICARWTVGGGPSASGGRSYHFNGIGLQITTGNREYAATTQEIGAAAEMGLRDGKLVIEVTMPRRRKRRYTLDELVAGITPENRHGEIDWGPRVGNEVW